MKRTLLAFVLFLYAAIAAADDIARIDIVVASATPHLQELAQAVQHELQEQAQALPITIRASTESEIAAASHALLINIDEQLLPWTYSAENHYAATINFYVNSTDLTAVERNDTEVTALFRDQPLSRQLQLAKFLIPNLHKVALLYDRTPSISIAELQHKTNTEIETLIIHDQPDWAKSLSQLLQHSDVLLGIDDPHVYNSETIGSILLTAYRHGKVLIGPSRPFVSAGSLASCYTSPADYLQQLAAMVKTRLQQGRLPPPQYPRVFNVAINPQVAVSLNLSIPDEKALSAWVQDQTGECGDGC